MNEMLKKWREVLSKPSENLATNGAIPQHLADKLLEENESLDEKLKFVEIDYPSLEGKLNSIKGLNILAGLQTKTRKKRMLNLISCCPFSNIQTNVWFGI